MDAEDKDGVAEEVGRAGTEREEELAVAREAVDKVPLFRKYAS